MHSEMVERLAEALYERDAREHGVVAAVLGDAVRWGPWADLAEASRMWWYDEARVACGMIAEAFMEDRLRQAQRDHDYWRARLKGVQSMTYDQRTHEWVMLHEAEKEITKIHRALLIIRRAGDAAWL